MPLRVPPGRAGRVWLLRRLDTAQRGAELLDRKRQALLAEQARVRREADQAREAWQRSAAAVTCWRARAAILDGEDRLEQLARHVGGRASLQLTAVRLMGAELVEVRDLELPARLPVSALGGSSAAVLLADACREATVAAARLAAASRAESELAVQLASAARRLRALRQRWIPLHEQALAQLELALDESQREQAMRVRWLGERGGPSPRG